ncbi:C-type lectin domain-containing protein [Rubinisphaera sp.]|uniref:C-type lectin domain-containing protein n=1 Tax=Rubinisphaera sp. TaxID=2024857 RepID=UPI000C1169EF|nr:C-type lectin domain-containing protein [Rubinisphaera sp.]MBV09411.1 hypothetical protein [Rubinisphaera sp.]HCS54056.1 hypothetical protein [Planctomycetaceae bacterium]|tara:strand:- start:3516 stop:4373 length:858 start_codon:yes stop_codon:yes gene_type:complete
MKDIIMKFARPLVIILLLPLLMSNLCSAEDSIEKDLEESKIEYEKMLTESRDVIFNALEKRREVAQRSGDLKLLDKVQLEIKAFETQGVLPTTVNVRSYQYRINQARSRREVALRLAISNLTKNGDLARAREIQSKLEQFQASSKLRPEGTVRFNKKYYKVYTSQLSWNEAKKKCEQMGGQLVVINSKEENTFVAKLVALTDTRLVWIGCTDVTSEGTWTWVDEKKMNFKNWDHKRGQPNNCGEVEHYGVLLLGEEGRWWDYPDVPTQYPDWTKQGRPGFVCQWD